MLLLQLLANGVVNGSITALLAVGFGLAYRSARVFHLAYGGIFTLSAYALYVFYSKLSLPAGISLFLTLIIASSFGYLVERIVYRPFYKRKASAGVVLIASLGVYIIIENTIALLFGNEVKILKSGVEPSYSFLGIILTRIQIIEFVTGVSLLLLFWFVLNEFKIFKALWAMGDEPELISIMGLPLFRLRELVFILSSIFAAVPSLLMGLDIGIDPHMGMNAFLLAAVAVIVGGVDTYLGWILGGFTIAILESLAVWKISARWTPLITFGLLILILLLRPQGMLGKRRRLEEI